MFDAIRSRIINITTLQQLAAAVGDLARDASNAFGKFVPLAFSEFDALYGEPMYVGADAEPKAIFCARVRLVSALETPLTCGVGTHYVWEEKGKRARVTSIDGLSPGVGNCRFTFLRVG